MGHELGECYVRYKTHSESNTSHLDQIMEAANRKRRASLRSSQSQKSVFANSAQLRLLERLI